MQKTQKFIMLCVIVQHIIFDIGMTLERKKNQVHNTGIMYPTSRNDENSSNYLLEEAIKFTNETDQMRAALAHNSALASFEYDTNLTDFNRKKMLDALSASNKFRNEAAERASRIDWRRLKGQDDLLYRWFKLFLGVRNTDDKLKHMETSDDSMEEIYSNARFCPNKSSRTSECNLTLFPDVKGIIETLRDPDDLQYLWKQVRDLTGKKMRTKFIKDVTLSNEVANKKNFTDAGEKMRNIYESQTFLSDISEIMRKILPLYKKFHAYIRKKLIKFYRNVYIAEDGPIPAHLLGDIYAQNWQNILDITEPHGRQTINVTDIIVKKNMDTIDMFMMAEDFFLSLGLERMTPHFWSRSVLEKPTDRNMTCNAAAYDMKNGKDFRIRMCTKNSDQSLNTIFHEMGHIEQYMQYRNLSFTFRDSANPGFHEAVGEVVSLSVSTLDYLKKAGYVNESVQYDDDLEIAYLFKTALSYMPTIPYAYIIDHYRYGIYNGSITTNKLNRMWWKYRLEYQGICPPVLRSERDFDAGAKYHIANNVEYMRYFVANIVAFQMHKALCKAAGHSGDLFKCSIYGSKAVGDLFKKVLSLGKTKPWQEVMLILTGDTCSIDPKPFLEYFEKLEIWLETGENKDNVIGWKSKNPMVCPGKRRKKKIPTH